MSLLTYGLPLTLVPLTDDSFVAVLFHEMFRHDNRYAYRSVPRLSRQSKVPSYVLRFSRWYQR